MKQVFTSFNHLVRNCQVFNGNVLKKMFSRILILLLLVFLSIINSSFKTEVHQQSIDKANQLKRSVPFKGNLSVRLGVIVTGSGVASHIGRFDYLSVDDPSNFPFLSGSATLTAANGDEIFSVFTGYLVDLGNGTLSLSFDNTITGGTGRFAGATGSFTSTGLANGVTQTATTTFDGTISY